MLSSWILVTIIIQPYMAIYWIVYIFGVWVRCDYCWVYLFMLAFYYKKYISINYKWVKDDQNPNRSITKKHKIYQSSLLLINLLWTFFDDLFLFLLILLLLSFRYLRFILFFFIYFSFISTLNISNWQSPPLPPVISIPLFKLFLRDYITY